MLKQPVSANYRALTPKGKTQLAPFPIRLGEDTLNDLDVIRRKLMTETRPPSACSVAVAIRRAVHFYATHLKRIGEARLSSEIEKAVKDTNYNRVASVCTVGK